MRCTVLTLLLLAAASAAGAQSPSGALFEIRPNAGVMIPTGAQRDLVRTAPVYSVQTAMEMTRSLHVVGSFAWSPGRLAASDQSLDNYQYDVGVEFNLVEAIGKDWNLKPFVGMGAGARTYTYAADDIPTRTGVSGYVSVGTEFQLRLIALRLETREFRYRYTYPDQASSRSRKDVSLSAGIAYHFGPR